VTDSLESQTARYPVRFVAVRTGLTAHVLRAWERRYGVVSPARTEGGQRLYSDRDIERLRLLRRLTDRGHAIREIASLPIAELGRLDKEAGGPEGGTALADGAASPAIAPEQNRAGSVTEYIVAALQATRRLDAVELQSVLERSAVTLGVPVFIDEVVAPTLLRVGHGWAEGLVSVAQEHMATAVVRRVLFWLFRVYEVRGNAPRLVVATPPGQVHELGALMAATSAAAEGWGVTYLGPDLPVPDLLRAVRQTDARAVAVSAVYAPKRADLLAALREMRAGLPEQVPLLVGGAATREIGAEAEATGARVIESLPKFRAALRRLVTEEGE
jgi:DNA-binding transcriptional MerR regulator/methylmalonyl-CoA mutase cobalamin-binding subunit